MVLNSLKLDQLNRSFVDILAHIIDTEVLLLQDSNSKIALQGLNVGPKGLIGLEQTGNGYADEDENERESVDRHDAIRVDGLGVGTVTGVIFVLCL